MNKAVKYRLYPTNEQKIMFAKTFGCCRKVYNLMLTDKIASYKDTKSFGKQTPAMYKSDYPFLKEVDSLALANVQLNLQSAMKSCFDKSRKKQNGFPKFKSAKHSRKSYTTNNQKGTVAIVSDWYIRLPKIGKVKAVIHRKPDAGWTLKSATISQENVFTIILFWLIVWILYESYKLLMCNVFPFEHSCAKQNEMNKKLFYDTEYTIESIKNQDDMKDIYSIYNPEDITFVLADNTLFVVKKENLHTLIKTIKLTEQEAYGLRERQILDFSYLDEVYQIICNQLENNIDNTGRE